MKGEVVYLFAFDVAGEIDVAGITTILSERPVPYNVRTDRTWPRDVQFCRPPAVEQTLPETVSGSPIQALIRVYEVGAITVSLRVKIEADELFPWIERHNPHTADGASLDELARRICEQVRENLGDLLVNPTASTAPEAYTVFCLTEIPGVTDTDVWLTSQRRVVAGLLTETPPERLSEEQVTEVLRLKRSFEKTDLVVIDWDAALIVDLDGYVEDVLFVLELANLQLEEFRAMDRMLDVYLNRAYDDLQRRSFSLFGIAFAVLRVLRQYRVDLTKLADEVTHITKFFGDWHLARVHSAARERFSLDQWRSSVERRLSQLDQLYGVVKSEAYEQRMFWLEILVAVFFAIDLWAIFFLKK